MGGSGASQFKAEITEPMLVRDYNNMAEVLQRDKKSSYRSTSAILKKRHQYFFSVGLAVHLECAPQSCARLD